MTQDSRNSRRDFLKATIGVGMAGFAAPYILPSGIIPWPGRVTPNDKITLGAIGTGSRSFSDTGALNQLADCRVVAVCDVDLTRARRDAAPNRLNITDEKSIYQDYRRLLERKDIDAVVIASPDHWHALHSIHAAQAGKDVYCEKAMTLTINEGRAMVKAMRSRKRVLQVGSQQRSSADFHRACMLVRNGYIGKVTKVVAVNFAGPWESKLPAQPVPDSLNWDMWLGPAAVTPFNENIRTSRSRPGWLSLRPFCGGEICGWGAHDLDQIQWALGYDESGPSEVWVEGAPYKPWVAEPGFDHEGRFFGPQEAVIHYRYPDGTPVECSEVAVPNGGALFIGEKGQIRIDRSRFEVSNPEWKTIPLDTMPIQLKTAASHYRNFADCIKSREKPVADVEIGHRSSTMLHMGNIARWVSQRTQAVGQKLAWDAKGERFTNSDLANSFLDRPRRKGYELPAT